MPPLTFARLCIAAALLAAISARTQETPPRQAVFGIARHADGSAWSGAKVRLTGLCNEIFDPTCDVVETTADDRGRFRAGILPGLTYDVRAHEERGDAVLVSAAQRTRRAPIVLEAESEVRRLRVDISGLAAWRDGSHSIRFWVSPDDSQRMAVPFRLATSGPTDVPTFSAGSHLITITSDNGSCLFRAQVQPSSGSEPIAVRIPPPRVHRFRIVDESLRPIPGARIVASLVDRIVQLAETDERGFITLRVPVDPATHEQTKAACDACLRIRAPGFEGGSFSVDRDFFASADDPSRLHQTLVLARARGLRGRVLDGGSGVDNALLVVRGRAQPMGLRRGKPVRVHASASHDLLATDATGRFDLDVGVKSALVIGVVLDEDRLARFAKHLGPVHPVAWAWAASAQPESGDLGDLRLDRLRAVRIAVRHADRRPAPYARITVGLAARKRITQAAIQGLTTDPSGRLTLLLPPTTELVVGVSHASAGDVVELAIPPPGARPLPKLADVELVLPEPCAIVGRVTAQDKPVEGIRLSAQFPNFGLGGSSHAEPPDAARTPGGPPVILARACFDRHTAHSRAIFFAIKPVHTDSTGRYRWTTPFGAWPVVLQALGEGENPQIRLATVPAPLPSSTTLDWEW